MKKSFVFLVALLMLLALHTGPALADTTFSGKDDFATYKFIVLEDGTAALREYLPIDKLATSVTLPETVQDDAGNVYPVSTVYSLDDNKFGYLSVTTLRIPDNITLSVNIRNPFYICENLESFLVSDSHPTMALIDGVLFNKMERSLISYPRSKANETNIYRIPEGITAVASRAFCDVKDGLSDITLPDSLVTINGNPFYGARVRHFTLSEGHPVFAVTDGFLCDKTSQRLICRERGTPRGDVTVPDGIAEIEAYAFAKDSGIRQVTLPSSVKVIDDFAFDHSSVESIVLPEGLERIGRYAFEGCQSLLSVSLPDTLLEIGDSAFFGCFALQSVRIPASLKTFGERVFEQCDGLKQVTIENGLEKISGCTFIGCEGLEEIRIPDSVTEIGYSAFQSCSSLKHITLSENLESLQGDLFYECSSLESVTVPAGVRTIEYLAFNGCTALKEVILREGLLEIGDRAFDQCTSLKTLAIPASVTKIALNAFGKENDLTLLVKDGSTAHDLCVKNQWAYEVTDARPAEVIDWLQPAEPAAPVSCPACGIVFSDYFTVAEGYSFKFCPECGAPLGSK